MLANTTLCPKTCKCLAHCSTLSKSTQNVAASALPDFGAGEYDLPTMVAAARQYDHTVSHITPLCQVMCEIGPHWKSELIKKALGQAL